MKVDDCIASESLLLRGCMHRCDTVLQLCDGAFNRGGRLRQDHIQNIKPLACGKEVADTLQCIYCILLAVQEAPGFGQGSEHGFFCIKDELARGHGVGRFGCEM